MSDKQEAFVAGIAAEFPGVPHRYCDNHFLRDLAKPVLEKDSHAKVQMRRKVRGLRTIEQAVLREEAKTAVSEEQRATASPPPAGPNGETSAATARPPKCRRGRGVCRGGSLVRRGSLGGGTVSGGASGLGLLCGRARDLERRSRRPAPSARAADGGCAQGGSRVPRPQSGGEKRGAAEKPLQRLAACIDRGLEAVEEVQGELRPQVEKIQAVADTLDPAQGSQEDRRGEFEKLRRRFSRAAGPVRPAHGETDGQLSAGVVCRPGR